MSLQLFQNVTIYFLLKGLIALIFFAFLRKKFVHFFANNFKSR